MRFRELEEFIRRNPCACLATVYEAYGSTPLNVCAKMCVGVEGNFCGTIGGGVAEYQVIRAAVDSLKNFSPSIVTLDLGEKYSRFGGPVCGGKLRVLVAPISDYGKKVISQVATYETGGSTIVFAQELPSLNSPQCEFSAARDSGELHLLEKSWGIQVPPIEQAECGVIFSESGRRVFFEYIRSPNVVHVFGSGHCGVAVANLAIWLGFECNVVDDRGRIAGVEEISPQVNLLALSPLAYLSSRQFGENDSFVLVGKGHVIDRYALEAIYSMKLRHGYVGMIGSRRKVALLFQELVRSGLVSKEFLAKVYAPIGLEIGSESPREIALSILSQILAVRSESGATRDGRLSSH